MGAWFIAISLKDLVLNINHNNMPVVIAFNENWMAQNRKVDALL